MNASVRVTLWTMLALTQSSAPPSLVKPGTRVVFNE
jgi:hypothetical protein